MAWVQMLHRKLKEWTYKSWHGDWLVKFHFIDYFHDINSTVLL